jgi:hypothetical protein
LIDPLPAPNAGRSASAVIAEIPRRLLVIKDLVIDKGILMASMRIRKSLMAARQKKTAIPLHLFPKGNRKRDARRALTLLAGHSVGLFF